jgi:hypothetical protein
MSGRVDTFAILKDATSFTTKPRGEKPVEQAAIDDLAKQNNFPSRQAPDKAPKRERRKPRRYKTGRNQQLNIKATSETIERFLKAADAENVPLGEMLKRALDVFEANRPQKNS